MATSSEEVIDDRSSPPDPPNYPPRSVDPDAAMGEIGAQKHELHFVFEFDLPTSGPRRSKSTVSELVSSVLQKLLEIDPDAELFNRNRDPIETDDFPTEEEIVCEAIEILRSPKGRQQKQEKFGFLVVIQSSLSSSWQFKNPMMSWLKTHKISMWPFHYRNDYSMTESCRILIYVIPAAEYLFGMEETVNKTMLSKWNAMTTEAKDELARDNSKNLVPEVRLVPGRSSWKIQRPSERSVETKGIQIFCAKEMRRAVKELISTIYPADANTSKQPVFVPSSMPHEKSIPDASGRYFALLCSQNAFLANHDHFRITGISDAVMTSMTSQGKLLYDLLATHAAIHSIRPTYAHHSHGTWSLVTYKDKMHEAIAFVDQKLATIVAQLSAQPPPNHQGPVRRTGPQSKVHQQNVSKLHDLGKSVSSTASDKRYAKPDNNRWLNKSNAVPKSIRSQGDASYHSNASTISADTRLTQLSEQIESMQTLIKTMSDSSRSTADSLRKGFEARITQVESQFSSNLNAVVSSLESIATRMESVSAPAPTAPFDHNLLAETVAAAVSCQFSQMFLSQPTYPPANAMGFHHPPMPPPPHVYAPVPAPFMPYASVPAPFDQHPTAHLGYWQNQMYDQQPQLHREHEHQESALDESMPTSDPDNTTGRRQASGIPAASSETNAGTNQPMEDEASETTTVLGETVQELTNLQDSSIEWGSMASTPVPQRRDMDRGSPPNESASKQLQI